MTTAVITPETPQQPDVARLLSAADQRSAALYPAESRHGAAVHTLVAQNAYFCVARLDGQAIGCGGFVAAQAATAELKRIFVDAAVRGTGVGRLLLAALEEAARRQGIVLMQLETGVKSVEALGLYHRFGYVERGPFADYRPDPLSVFMEKPLA